MSNLTILGDTSGSVVLQAPAVAGSTTINMPAATGTMMVSGNMPAFRAYKSSSSQSISTSSTTKVLYETESFDTNNCFASSRFTPNVAGYYQLTASAQFEGATGNTAYQGVYYIYKNGSAVAFSNVGAGTTTYPVVAINDIQYANGTTDYFEIYFYQNTGSTKALYGDTSLPTYTWFAGALVRSA